MYLTDLEEEKKKLEKASSNLRPLLENEANLRKQIDELNERIRVLNAQFNDIKEKMNALNKTVTTSYSFSLGQLKETANRNNLMMKKAQQRVKETTSELISHHLEMFVEGEEIGDLLKEKEEETIMKDVKRWIEEEINKDYNNNNHLPLLLC